MIRSFGPFLLEASRGRRVLRHNGKAWLNAGAWKCLLDRLPKLIEPSICPFDFA
jgi:hypothetical protein